MPGKEGFLTGQTALVTGAGRGIGLAIARILADQGAGIVVNDFEAGSAGAAAEQIKALGVPAVALTADVADPDSVAEMVGRAEAELGPINILINNAGIGGSSCLVQEMPAGSWERTVAVNLSGVFNCCRAVVPKMIEQGHGGRIVNIASLAARRMSKLGGADYTAAKWGVVGFSKHLAFELATHRINVNVVCPGATLTPLVESKTSPEFRAEVAEQVPLGDWISPEDQAQAVLFLVGPGSKMITGHVLDVEGGQLLGLAADYKEDLARRTEGSARNLKQYQKSTEDKA